MKTCKHPVISLTLKNCYDSSPDGYGGHNEWKWTELQCQGCKKAKKVWDTGTIQRVSTRHYYEVTERHLTLDELKALYLRNKLVYKWVEKTYNEDDAVKRSVGKRTDALGKKIEAKKKLVGKHQKELDAMVSEYNG